MKKTILACLLVAFFSACNGEGKVNEQEIEAAGDKLKESVQEGVDTVGSKLKKLKNKIEDRLDSTDNN